MMKRENLLIYLGYSSISSTEQLNFPDSSVGKKNPPAM